MKAGLVAAELRKLADSLDAQPDAEIIKPYIWFHGEEKDTFLATTRLLPRPLAKELDGFGDDKYRKIRVKHEAPAMYVEVNILRSLTCELVEPAKPAVYRCAPILSEEEEAEVVA